MFSHLLNGTPLFAAVGKPSWEPSKPPSNYEMCLPRTRTMGMKGLGEMIWDLCYERSCPVMVTARERQQFVPILVSSDLAAQIDPKYFKGSYINVGPFSGNTISLADSHREGDKASILRRTLTSGIFPIWAVSKVESDSFAQWKSGCPSQKDAPRSKFKGELLFSSGKLAGLRES